MKVGPDRLEARLCLIIYTVALVVDLPRHGSGAASVRPFNVIASEVDVLLEIKPEGKVRYFRAVRWLFVDPR